MLIVKKDMAVLKTAKQLYTPPQTIELPPPKKITTTV